MTFSFLLDLADLFFSPVFNHNVVRFRHKIYLGRFWKRSWFTNIMYVIHNIALCDLKNFFTWDTNPGLLGESTVFDFLYIHVHKVCMFPE